jgi:hypothetical protein
MTAQIVSSYDFLWKLVARDLDSFFAGGSDLEKANIGRALGFRLLDQIEPIKDCWAEARRIKGEQRQREGA